MVNIFKQEREKAGDLLVNPHPIDQDPVNETKVSHICAFLNVMAFDHT